MAALKDLRSGSRTLKSARNFPQGAEKFRRFCHDVAVFCSRSGLHAGNEAMIAREGDVSRVTDVIRVDRVYVARGRQVFVSIVGQEMGR